MEVGLALGLLAVMLVRRLGGREAPEVEPSFSSRIVSHSASTIAARHEHPLGRMRSLLCHPLLRHRW